MNRIKYNAEEESVVIYGCETCPFCHYDERGTDYGPFCSLDMRMAIEDRNEDHAVIKYFPENCPLRSPNFKLIRCIEV